MSFQWSTANALYCSPTYGSAINPSDCSLALTIFESKLRTHPQPILPLGSTFHTCAMGVSHSAHASDNPSALPILLPELVRSLVLNLVALIEPCVGSGSAAVGHGGVLKRHGLTFVVVNPLQVPVYGTCLAPPEPSGMDLSQCIEWRQELRRLWDLAPSAHAEEAEDVPSGREQEGSAELRRETQTRGRGGRSRQDEVLHALAPAEDAPDPFGSFLDSPPSSENVSVTAWA